MENFSTEFVKNMNITKRKKFLDLYREGKIFNFDPRIDKMIPARWHGNVLFKLAANNVKIVIAHLEDNKIQSVLDYTSNGTRMIRIADLLQLHLYGVPYFCISPPTTTKNIKCLA